ncbi:phage distal tail protein [Micromonospora carbonacea]|uniref:Phage tail protein n=1 Tax=Micromonospora carbonacea TaxID=47853 RepID=A0A1C4WZL6_9ACTN|nr:phage tail family protein [Micromonospora carbonacea]SCF01653.1 Phage tail protein [Micromonospora carbonacea]
MALAEGQWQLRGLVMGPGTAYRVTDETNPWQTQVRAEQGGPRAWAHGSWSGVEWAAERVVPMRILVDVGADDVAAVLEARHALAAAWAPVGTGPDVPLRWVQGGREYLLLVRPRMAEPEMSLLGAGRMWVRCAAVALDPMVYSSAEHSAGPLGLPTWTGGLTVPVRVPFSIGASQTSGQVDLTNAGSAEVGLLLRIDGPVNQPRVSLTNPDDTTTTLRVDLEVPDSQWLDIDTRTRTVILNGDPSASRRGQAVGDFPLLQPGTSTLRFAAAEEASGTVTARWRDGWW